MANLTLRSQLTRDLSVSEADGNLRALNLDISSISSSVGVLNNLSTLTGVSAISAIEVGTNLATGGTVEFANGNGISFGLDGQTITASHNGLTTQSAQVLSAGNGSSTFESLSFANASGVSWSVVAGGIRATVKTDYLTTASPVDHTHGNPTLALTNLSGSTASASNGLTISLSANQAGLAISAPGSSQGSGTVQFSNGNGVTFGMNGATITASHNGLTTAAAVTHTHGPVSLALTNVSATANSASNGLTLSISGPGQVTTNGLISAVRISAGTESQNVSALTFANGNGVSFGFDDGVITGSVAAAQGAQTGISGIAAQGGTATSGTVSFGNANGISFGIDGQTLTASHNALTSQSVQTQGSVVVQGSTGQISFGNANGLSFGANGSTITASYTVPSATVFSNSNNVTFGLNGSTVTASASYSQSAQTQSNIQGLIASNTTFRTGDVSFSNGNGVSFATAAQAISLQHALQYTSNTSAITSAALHTSVSSRFAGTGTSATNATITLNSNGIAISVAAPGAGGGGAALSAGTQSVSSGTVAFANSNGISFGMSGSSQITASYTVPGATVFSNSNNVSFGLNGSTVTASASFAQTVQTQGSVQVQGSTGAISFDNANGITFGGNAGTITASYTVPNVPAQTVQTQSNVQGILVSNATYRTGDVSFSNANGISFGSSAGQAVTISHALQFSSNTSAITANALNTSQSSLFQHTSATSAITANALNTSQSSLFQHTSATSAITSNALNTSVSSRFAGTGTSATNASITLNSNGLAISVANPGGAGGGIALAASNSTFTNGTVIISGVSGAITVTNAAQQVGLAVPATSSLVGVNGISLSTNGSTISISRVSAADSGHSPYADLPWVTQTFGQGQLALDPMPLPDVCWDRVRFPVIISNASASSGSQTISAIVGLYSRNGSTLSLVASASTSYGLTQSGTVGVYSSLSGLRAMSIPWTTTVTDGQYWAGLILRSTSAGAAGFSISNFQVSAGTAANFVGDFSAAHNTTMQLTLGQGIYTATTAAMPSSIGFSQIRGSDSQVMRANVFSFAYSTV